MNSLSAILIAVFGVIITIVLLASMTEIIENGVKVKMDARLEHLADDVANAVQHLSSSTIDSATESFDVDIKDVSIKIENNKFVTVTLNDVEFTDQFHIADGIMVEDSEVHDPSMLCFVKHYDSATQTPTIIMTDYDNSPCDIEQKEVDLRYGWDWGFETEQQIDGAVNSPDVDVTTTLPIGKIKSAAFHDFDISTASNKFFRVKPEEQSRYSVKFNIFVPDDTQSNTVDNYAEFTLDISPLYAVYTDVIYKSWHIPDCADVAREFNCITKADQEITFKFTKPWWPNMAIINTQATKYFYDWNFVDTKSFYDEDNMQYPNSTVSMVKFHDFVIQANKYIEITPGDFGRNYFSFGLLVPDDNDGVTINHISLTLAISPFYSMNVDLRNGAKIVPECTSMERPCFRRLGSEIMLELEPGTYDLTVEDPAY